MLTELRQLPAPAKINLFLHVTGRRADGYHLLETVFQLVDLADRIDLRRRDDGAVRRTRAWDPGVPEADDLVVKAALALRQATGCRAGVDIAVDKRIPTGAGLGGGSSDAATVLLGLNRLWGLGLDRQRLIEIGVTLGADVPVFLFGENAYATGIGEILVPIALPPRWFVLAMPAVAVATGSVFGDPDLTRNTEPIKITGFSARGLCGRNDLEPVVLAKQPAVREVRDRLLRAVRAERSARLAGLGGADGAAEDVVRMTGSGACLFAVADTAEEASRIAAAYDALAQREEDRPDAGLEPGREAGMKAGIEAAGKAAAEEAAGEAVKRSASSTVHVVAGLPKHPLGSRQVG